eukprot:CAMPEP_0115073562 /NCGR_PEP_ID=MMETSP0227-20121206/14849_1 /TAXON_ID=89957 /ORGANISM="Polarella glacialis, Strain CCMP 1383" /LENGTH=236 /DNA_ID=CAMNT_0002460423 /DNA_START=120 /DNA_END=830 /DNA_ORIENTATION=+
MAMLGKVLLAALCVSSAVSYKLSANCVEGFIVGGVSTLSTVGHYTPILQSLLPTTYGKLKLLAVGAQPDCEHAANAINENTVSLYKVAKKYYLQALNPSQVSQPANIQRSYLYVFETGNYSSYHFISVCTAGFTVASMNQTGGRIALYVVALQTLMPRLYGDFNFLGKSETAAECLQASNLVNSANATVLTLLHKHHFPGVKSVGLFGGLEKGNASLTYLYVFRNKVWNETTQWWM